MFINMNDETFIAWRTNQAIKVGRAQDYQSQGQVIAMCDGEGLGELIKFAKAQALAAIPLLNFNIVIS